MSIGTHETKIHGRLDFPYIVYTGKIPEFLHNYPLHWHEEFEIIYIEHGTGCISVQSRPYICTAGDVVLIPPQSVHDIRQTENKSMRYFNILFKFSLLEENENSVCYKKYFQPYTDDSQLSSFHLPKDSEINRKIAPHIQELIAHRKEKYTTNELMIKSHLYAVLFEINSLLIPMTTQGKSMHSSIARLKPVLRYIQEEYQKEITVKEAAELSNLSESHFMKSFKNLTGISLIKYVNSVRLENAERLLKNTDKSVSEICEECGFHYFSYFIRTFKSTYGCTPGDLRKKAAEATAEKTSAAAGKADFARNASYCSSALP